MSTTRLHDKFHRQNHHTYKSTVNPDAGHDPIASPSSPFLGDFNLSGALSGNCPLSAYGAVFRSNFTGVSAIGGNAGVKALTTHATSYDLAPPDTNIAGLYCYGFASDVGPYSTVSYVRGFIPKALICDGYADFRFPIYAHSIYSPLARITALSASNITTPSLTATVGTITNLTVNTLTVVALSSVTTTSATTTATNFSASGTLSGSIVDAGYVKSPARTAVAMRLTASSTIPQNTWTLVPLVTARYNPYNWMTAFGTISADKQGLYMCEFTALARALSGSPLNIVAGVTTNTAFNALTSTLDSVSPFAGTDLLSNNGVTFTGTTGVSGVTFQGTTLIALNGTGEHVGCYFYNSGGQSVVDYMRLRLVHLNLTTS